MPFIWMLVVSFAVFLLGYIVAPIIGGVFTIAVQAILQPISRVGAYFIARYLVFAAEFTGLFIATRYLGEWTGAWMVLPWIIFAWVTFAGFNTLYMFDRMCWLSQSGIWAIIRHENA